MTIADYNLAIGDFVTYDRGIGATGGVIYQITENVDPVECTVGQYSRKSKNTSPYYRYRSSMFYMTNAGKKVGLKEKEGYIRLRPAFDFFATKLGKNPGGVNGTKIVHHRDLKKVVKMDIVALGVKYLELGNFIKDIASNKGMQVE